ncbi:hypothetical protein JOD57_000614 [Geodermatophilus bullaregiensis]|uniref:hypothetical protein n=1 Tax=Geodermatophilus bullaregiensis TaxID=1564160 RepID=UPI00195E8E13|nr:hypothetical protein [Geodermatophilus bullaregiensis]MBM7804777.1 hypothetical protein [Geodermatophilus bullaregiensis]
MVLLAGLLVLAGLGLFVTGVLTDVATWYWACVATCGLAAVLLLVARLRTPAGDRSPVPDTPARPVPPATDHGPTRGDTPRAPAQPTADRHGAPATRSPEDGARPAAPPATRSAPGGPPAAGEPAEEDVEVTDLLLVVDLTDEVLVVDEHPRYHLGGCRWLAGREIVPLPVGEARTDGFTPCAVCGPDAHLAGVERARRAARRA